MGLVQYIIEQAFADAKRGILTPMGEALLKAALRAEYAAEQQ